VDFLIAVTSAALVGALVASRRPRTPVGWFILSYALCFSLGEFGRRYAIYGILTTSGALPFARAMIWPTYLIWYPDLTFDGVLHLQHKAFGSVLYLPAKVAKK
jgi:hypothetical protein